MQKKWFISFGMAMIISIVNPAYGMETEKQKEEKEFLMYFKTLPQELQLATHRLLLMQEAIPFLAWQPISFENGDTVSAVAISDDILITGSERSGRIKVWNMANGQPLYTLKKRNSSIASIAINGNIAVATAGFDDIARVWNITNGQILYELEIDYADSVAINNNFVVGSSDTIKIWDITNGQLLHTLEGSAGPVAISGNLMAFVVSPDKKATILKITKDTIQPLLTLTQETDQISNVTISGNKLVTVSGQRNKDDMLVPSNTAKVWDLNGQLLHTLVGHTKFIYKIAISDNLVVTGSRDNTVKVWDINKAEPLLHTFEVPSISSVAINKDFVIVGSHDQSAIKIWSLSPFKGTTQDNPLVWIIHNADMSQLNFINRAYEATIGEQELIMDSKDLKLFIELPLHVKRYLIARLKINISKQGK